MFSRIFSVCFTIFLILPTVLLAIDPSAEELYDRIYGKAYENLHGGDADQKIIAAYILGTQRKEKFVRPLSQELLKGLDDEKLKNSSSYGPYVKSQIAWALGRIGNRQALPPLVKALEITIKNVEDDLIASTKKRESLAQSKSSYPVVMDKDKPGPTHLKKGSRFPDSPDVYWSLAEDLKTDLARNPEDVDYRIKLQGYNHLNLILAILEAIGEITKNTQANVATGSLGAPIIKQISETRALLGKMLDHRLSSVRGGTALALGEIGDEESMGFLNKRFLMETDFTVKTQIARGILWNDRTKTLVKEELVKMLGSEDIEVRLEASRAMRDIGLGESLGNLQEALNIEHDPRVRAILKQAIFHAQIDNVMPVNY